MTGRLRYLLAAAFVAVFFLAPAADHGRIALLKTRSWLKDDEGALAHATGNLPDAEPSPVPGLQVDLAEQGVERARSDATAREYARTAREWARGKDLPFDPDLLPLRLTVRVGSNGFEATLLGADGSELVDQQGDALELRVLREARDGAPASDAYYPDRLSLIPAFLAIVLAILTGKVIPSLLLGCLAGAVLFAGWNPLAGTSHFVVGTVWERILTDLFNVEIMGFVVFLFMTVGVMSRSGGIQGMVEWVRRFAKGPVSTQMCSYVIGILIFFDDYSNCIISGTTMRPLTDRMRIAREKLSYIVDSTAAPIAGISIFSTWVAYEVSMFAPQLPEVTKADGVTPYEKAEGFAVFVATLPFRFYCVFTLVMVFLTIVMRREFGPMLHAARRAHEHGKPVADDAQPLVAEGLAKTEPPPGAPHRGRNGLLPIVVLVVTTIILIFTFGSSQLSAADTQLPLWQRIPKILGEGQSQRALCYASFLALGLAIALSVGQRILTFKDALVSALRSAHSLMFAVVILVLAWSIGKTCEDLGTAQFLTAAFHGTFDPWLLPVVMFLLSSLVSFSTGTSYGTMAILLPNVVVLAHTMGATDADLGGPALMILTIGAVLEGSIFGDHCSPISDTTVLSSVATGSDHLHHVRTQAPYAVLVMIVAVVCGYLPAALLGPSFWPLAWALGVVAIAVFLVVVGRDPTRSDHRSRLATSATRAGSADPIASAR